MAKQRELQSRFREARTEHFTALFEMAADEPLARGVTERLEAAYRRIGNTLGIHPSQPVTWCSTPESNSDDITKLAAWSVAAYDGRIRLPIRVAEGEPGSSTACCHMNIVHAVIGRLGGNRARMAERGSGHGTGTRGLR